MKKVREIDPAATSKAEGHPKASLPSRWRLSNDTAEKSSAFNTPRVATPGLPVHIPLQRYDLNEIAEEGHQRVQNVDIDRQRGNAFDPKLMVGAKPDVPAQRPVQGGELMLERRTEQLSQPAVPVPPPVRGPTTVPMPVEGPFGVRPLMSGQPTPLALTSPLFMQMSTIPASFSIYNNKPLGENNAQHI